MHFLRCFPDVGNAIQFVKTVICLMEYLLRNALTVEKSLNKAYGNRSLSLSIDALMLCLNKCSLFVNEFRILSLRHDCSVQKRLTYLFPKKCMVSSLLQCELALGTGQSRVG